MVKSLGEWVGGVDRGYLGEKLYMNTMYIQMYVCYYFMNIFCCLHCIFVCSFIISNLTEENME